MKRIECNHIRVKDAEYEIDTEKLINFIETQFKVNFKSLPNWKDLIRKLQSVRTYYDRKAREVSLRELLIINKLYIENSRPSPFELTDQLSRTAKTWQKKPQICRQQNKISFLNDVVPEPTVQSAEDTANISDSSLVKVEESQGNLVEDEKRNNEKDVILNALNMVKSLNLTNRNKLLSPLDSEHSDLSYHSTPSISLNEKIESKDVETEIMDNDLIKCYPKKVIISKDTFEEQCVEFSLKNVSTYCFMVIFKNITNLKPFKKACVFPYVTLKLYPGLSIGFKLVFKLKQTKAGFSTNLLFRTQYKISDDIILTQLCVPIFAQFIKPPCVKVSKVVSILPVYEWHLNFKSGYPTGTLTLKNKDDKEYYLRIVKKRFLIEDTSTVSIQPIAPSTGSFIDRTENEELIHTWSTTTFTTKNQSEDKGDEEFMLSIIQDILECVLDIFIFDWNYICLPPKFKRNISVVFNKSENIGHHQRYYDIEFRDFNTEEIIETKTIKVYAEILPHPISINPLILDMDKSQFVHGVCKGYFIVNNMHRVYTANITIKTTHEMRKLICITPMKAPVLPKSNTKFQVATCSSEFPTDNESNEMIHFTIEVIATGVKCVYENIPPIYYEIIAPCAAQFRKMLDNEICIDHKLSVS